MYGGGGSLRKLLGAVQAHYLYSPQARLFLVCACVHVWVSWARSADTQLILYQQGKSCIRHYMNSTPCGLNSDIRYQKEISLICTFCTFGMKTGSREEPVSILVAAGYHLG